MCTRVLTCAGVWAPFFCHTSNEISTFSILTIAIVYESINISLDVSTVPVFRIEALQKYQYFQGNINSFAVCRFDQTFWGAETQVACFCARCFFHKSNGFSMILRHVQCHVQRRGEKSLFLHRFYKQNEIVSILLFGVLGGLEGALRHTCFATCFKTPARIKILRRNITFCALVPVGSLFHFLRQRDLEGAQDTFFEKCENVRKIKGNSSKRCLYELLKHRNIQNQPRIISKTDTLDFTQFDLLPRAPD